MKKLGYLIYAAAIFASWPTLVQAQSVEKHSLKTPLFIVTEAFEPLIFPPGAKLQGMDYEITQAVFNILNIPFVIEFYPFKRCLLMVKNKQAYAVVDLLATRERRNYLFFPDEPLSKSPEVIFHLTDNRPEINTLDDLKFYRVGIQLGYDYPSGLSKFIINREKVATIEQNLNKLILKRIDIIIHNRIVGLYSIRKTGRSHQVNITNLPGEFINRYHIGFAKKKRYNLLAKQFNRTLVKFKKTMAYKEILTKYVQTE